MLYKIIIVIIIIAIFYYTISNNIETFVNLNYENTNKFPWERNDIHSSIPYDIKSKYEDTYFYEYGNNEYEKRLNKIFNDDYMTENLITIVEGNKWSNWTNKINNKKKILEYYNNIYNYIENKINNSILLNLPNNKNNKINIANDKLISYKYNLNDTKYYMFNIEMVFYRNKKPLGKHIKFIVISNKNTINVINSKIIGVINEDNILFKDFKSYEDNNNYEEYPNNTVNYDLNSYVYEIEDEKKVNEKINNILYNKLLPNKLSNIPYEKEPDHISYINNEKYKKDMIDVRNSFLSKLKE